MAQRPVDVLDLLPRLDAAARARQHVRAALLAWHLDELLDPVLLLTSELVSNALLHAGTPLTVAVRPDGPGVRVEVRDGSPVKPAPRRHSTTATTGRGVQLLESLADDWGSSCAGEGKLVWFRVLDDRSWIQPFDVDLVADL
jgi:anti-sigma regulatory factor (Ser/Thr protein kinase)